MAVKHERHGGAFQFNDSHFATAWATRLRYARLPQADRRRLPSKAPTTTRSAATGLPLTECVEFAYSAASRSPYLVSVRKKSSLISSA